MQLLLTEDNAWPRASVPASESPQHIMDLLIAGGSLNCNQGPVDASAGPVLF